MPLPNKKQLYDAIERGDKGPIEAHLRAEGTPDATCDGLGGDDCTALGLAAACGRDEIAALLVDAGASLDLPNSSQLLSNGSQRSHHAVQEGLLSSVFHIQYVDPPRLCAR
jgi:hypothetical protein